jgi:hypothetical protein
LYDRLVQVGRVAIVSPRQWSEISWLGRLPEWPKGAVCKTVGIAYVGSNPTPATERKLLSDKTSHDWKRSSCGAEVVWLAVPGEVFVVEGVALQAAVEDADEPVGEGAQRLVVGGAAGTLAVVESSGSG